MKRAVLYLIFIFAINLPSMYFGWYAKWWWIDIILHFSGGFFVAMFMYHYLIDRLNNKDILKNIVMVAGATVLIGVLWEFAEYIANQTLINWTYQTFKIKVYFMGDLKDTMLDLSMDIIGSLAFYLGLVRK